MNRFYDDNGCLFCVNASQDSDSSVCVKCKKEIIYKAIKDSWKEFIGELNMDLQEINKKLTKKELNKFNNDLKKIVYYTEKAIKEKFGDQLDIHWVLPEDREKKNEKL